jgi:chemotaxis-related protein WspB
MLFLLFKLNQDKYALNIREVVEVLPMTNWKHLPGAQRGIAGLFNYHGKAVPLIDLSEMMIGQPSRALASTRIILVNYIEETGLSHLLGLLAEGVVDTFRRFDADFKDSEVTVNSAPYLRQVTTDEEGIVQRIEVKNLLSSEVRRELFHSEVL